MQTLTITTYSISELKELFPAGYDSALSHWQDRESYDLGIPWQDETIDSLKAVLKAAGVTLRDWSLGAYNRGNHISISFTGFDGCSNDEIEELSGKRAFAWLENNLFAGLRVRGNMRVDDWRKQMDPQTGHFRKGYKLDETARYYRTMDGKLHRREGKVGEVPSCPLTGYCADEDYLDSLRKAIRSGDTLKEAFSGLADVCEKLLESEAEHMQSAEYFEGDCEANEVQFTEDGERI